MYIDIEMVKQMLRNIEVVIKEGNKEAYSSIILTKHSHDDYAPVLETIKAYDETNFHKEIRRIAIIAYKKFTFVVGISYYTTGKAVALIKVPNNDEPIVLCVSANVEPGLFEVCYSISEKVFNDYYEEETHDFDVNDTMTKYSKWEGKKVKINKGLHNKRDREDEEPPNITTVFADDEMMNIINEYVEKCEQFYQVTNNKFDILMANVKTFDVGTVHTLDQLTNLVRYMYHEYAYNPNLRIYEDPFNDDSLAAECGLKFLLRHLDIVLENALNTYLSESGDEMYIDEFITVFEPELEMLRIGYDVDIHLRMYYDAGELGLFDMDNDVLIYQKRIIDKVDSLKLDDDDQFKKSFFEYDQVMKQFFMKLIDETNFIDLFLGIVFTDPVLLENFLKLDDFTDDANDDY